ncbi:MAG: hypothetical protein KDD25_03385 [Bdellovibrionales bacterium]|nr:hypothetical protein [Bdellovibrionales bacterium]
MLAVKRKSHLKSEKGLASIEAIFMSFLYMLLLSFGLGFFGIVHTGIVNSISARQYAFETFKNRTHLAYHRSKPGFAQVGNNHSYKRFGFRLHTILAEGQTGSQDFIAPARNLAMTPSFNNVDGTGNRNTASHEALWNLQSAAFDARRDQFRINPVWVKTGYGICLNAFCGASGGTP